MIGMAGKASSNVNEAIGRPLRGIGDVLNQLPGSIGSCADWFTIGLPGQRGWRSA
jgi:hypothetical protein